MPFVDKCEDLFIFIIAFFPLKHLAELEVIYLIYTEFF